MEILFLVLLNKENKNDFYWKILNYKFDKLDEKLPFAILDCKSVRIFNVKYLDKSLDLKGRKNIFISIVYIVYVKWAC